MRALTHIMSAALAAALVLSGCALEADDEEAADDAASSEEALSKTLSLGESARTTTRVNFRSAPTLSASTVIRVLPSGTEVKGTGTAPDGGFHLVTVNGERGFVHGTYLRPSGDGASSGSSGTASPSGRSHANVTMLWQGDWRFLTACDSYSRRAGRVVFACDEKPSRALVDDGAWIAVPSTVFARRLCGGTARVCKAGRCIDARIVERSVTSTRWEGSTAVLRTLGENPGWRSCTNSWGTATGVTVTL
jgi:hypothetical protein